jgi:GntR family transcriptional regulator of arabinose operon
MPEHSSILGPLPALGHRARRKHERIYDALMLEVTSGRLKNGDALPTEHQLAEMLNVSRSTIRQTLGELEKEGIVRRVRGKGTFVTGGTNGSPPPQNKAFAILLPETRIGFLPSLQRGFGSECNRAQYHMVVYDTDQDINKQSDAILRLIDQRVAAVAIMPPTTVETPPHHVRPLQDQGIPVVFCHRRVNGVKAPLVTFSGLEVGRTAGRAMGEHGHRTIAFLGSHSSEMGNQYETGLREAIQEFGGTLLEQHVLLGTHTHGPVPPQHEQVVEKKIRQVMDGKNPPTAIMVSFDSTAESLYLQLGHLGIRVPEDLSIVSFGGTWREGAITSRLTAVTVDEARLGLEAARLLHEMRQGSRPIDDEEIIVMPVGFSEGQTLAHVGCLVQ